MPEKVVNTSYARARIFFDESLPGLDNFVAVVIHNITREAARSMFPCVQCVTHFQFQLTERPRLEIYLNNYAHLRTVALRSV